MAAAVDFVGPTKQLPIHSKRGKSKTSPIHASYERAKVTLEDGSSFICAVGDYVTINAGEDEDYVARINNLFEEGKRKKMAIVQWMYRAQDFTKCKVIPPADSPPSLVYFTKHMDEIFATTITGLCRIRFSAPGFDFEYLSALAAPELDRNGKKSAWPEFHCTHISALDFKSVSPFTKNSLSDLIEEGKELALEFQNSVSEPEEEVTPVKPSSNSKKRVVSVEEVLVTDEEDEVFVAEKKKESKPKRAKSISTSSRKRAVVEVVVEESESDFEALEEEEEKVRVPKSTGKQQAAKSKKKKPTVVEAGSPNHAQADEGEFDGVCVMEKLFSCFRKAKHGSLPKSQLLDLLGFLFLASTNLDLLPCCPPFLLQTAKLAEFQPLLEEIVQVLFAGKKSRSEVVAALKPRQGGNSRAALLALERAKPGTVLDLLARGKDASTWFFPPEQPTSVFGALLLRGDGFASCKARFMNQDLIVPLPAAAAVDDDVDNTQDVTDIFIRGFNTLVADEFRFGVRREGDFLFGVYPAPGERCPCVLFRGKSGKVHSRYVPERARLGFLKSMVRALGESDEEGFGGRNLAFLGHETKHDDDYLFDSLQDNTMFELKHQQ